MPPFTALTFPPLSSLLTIRSDLLINQSDYLRQLSIEVHEYASQIQHRAQNLGDEGVRNRTEAWEVARRSACESGDPTGDTKDSQKRIKEQIIAGAKDVENGEKVKEMLSKLIAWRLEDDLGKENMTGGEVVGGQHRSVITEASSVYDKVCSRGRRSGKSAKGAIHDLVESKLARSNAHIMAQDEGERHKVMRKRKRTDPVMEDVDCTDRTKAFIRDQGLTAQEQIRDEPGTSEGDHESSNESSSDTTWLDNDVVDFVEDDKSSGGDIEYEPVTPSAAPYETPDVGIVDSDPYVCSSRFVCVKCMRGGSVPHVTPVRRVGREDVLEAAAKCSEAFLANQRKEKAIRRTGCE